MDKRLEIRKTFNQIFGYQLVYYFNFCYNCNASKELLNDLHYLYNYEYKLSIPSNLFPRKFVNYTVQAIGKL